MRGARQWRDGDGPVMRRWRRNSRGQSLVEFALVLPIFLLIFFGLIDVGRVVYLQNAFNEAAREGARYGSVEQWAFGCPASVPWRSRPGHGTQRVASSGSPGAAFVDQTPSVTCSTNGDPGGSGTCPRWPAAPLSPERGRQDKASPPASNSTSSPDHREPHRTVTIAGQAQVVAIHIHNSRGDQRRPSPCVPRPQRSDPGQILWSSRSAWSC
jgi:hypothetical protein